MALTLKEKILSRKASVAIIGLGYVGLPLALTLVKKGFRVVGIENDEKKIAFLKKGKSYIEDANESELQKVLKEKKFTPSDSIDLTKEADIILICVPTPLDKHKTPDTSFIKEAVLAITPHLQKGQLVIFESTSYPGCTKDLIKPLLEKSGLKAGKDFYLVVCPERIDPGNKSYQLSKIPRVIGGIDKTSGDLASVFYETFTPGSFKASSPEVAEMAKLLENIFRLVNISFINELKLLCDKIKIDIWEVIEAAKTKPYGFMPFYPGPGIGGHCIPDDPFYLSWKAREYGFYARFIEVAGEVNELMPHEVVTKVIWALNREGKALNSTKILTLGVAYKKDVGDLRESPALKIMWDLWRKKVNLCYHDPFVPEVRLSKDPIAFHAKVNGTTLKSVPLTNETIKRADLILILTDHSQIDYEDIAKKAKLIVDTRNAIKKRSPNVVRF